MALSLVTNIGSLIAANALTDNQAALNTSISQLSTGKRIVSAATDPGGLSIATETSGSARRAQPGQLQRHQRAGVPADR